MTSGAGRSRRPPANRKLNFRLAPQCRVRPLAAPVSPGCDPTLSAPTSRPPCPVPRQKRPNVPVAPVPSRSNLFGRTAAAKTRSGTCARRGAPPRSVASCVAPDSRACEANGPECRARRGVTRDMRHATRTGTTRDMRRISCRLSRVACRLRAALPLLPRRIPASGPARERPQNRTEFYVKYSFIIK